MTLDCGNRKADPSSNPNVVADRLTRIMRHAQITVGPLPTGKQVTSDGGSVWVATFTLGVGDPCEYGREIPVIEGWLDPDQTNPWAYGQAPAGASTSGPVALVDGDCPTDTFMPVFDPLRPGVTPPPAPSQIAWADWVAPATWNRYRAVIPASLVPTWNVALPVFRFAAAVEEARNVRVRIYRDPVNTGNMDPSAPCDWVSDFVVSYVPQGSVLVVDGVEQRVYVESLVSGSRVSDSLVFTTDGGPLVWPEFTTGVQHVVMLDLDPAEVPPVVDMALVERFG